MTESAAINMNGSSPSTPVPVVAVGDASASSLHYLENAVDRVKAAPVCVDTALQKESMSTQVLQQWVFAADVTFPAGSNSSSGSATTQTTASTPYVLNGGGSSWSRSSMASTATYDATTSGNVTSVLPESVTTTISTGGSTVAHIDNAPSILPSSTVNSDHPRGVPVSVVSVSSNNSCAGDSHAALSSDEMTEFVQHNKGSSNSNSNGSNSSSSSGSTTALKLRSGGGGAGGGSTLGMQPPSSSLEANHELTAVAGSGSSGGSASSAGQLNARVLLRKTSRQGRSSQRWVSIPSQVQANTAAATTGESLSGSSSHQYAPSPHFHHHEPLMRLVTGCVPILRNGKILFVSASRKSAWILPKGGWEQDESMEESAIRECFEEAGCLGTLGPALSAVQHETRKAKKRRLEQEQFLDQQLKSKSSSEVRIPQEAAMAELDNKVLPIPEDETTMNDVSPTAAAAAVGATTTTTTAEVSMDEAAAGSLSRRASTSPSLLAPVVLSAESLSRIRQFSMSARSTGGHHTDNETMSVGSTMSTTYTHVQMTLFPLYVQKIEDSWPEQGRFRRAVDIDEAIEMLANRPELQAALVEVKERGLHLVADESAAPSTTQVAEMESVDANI